MIVYRGVRTAEASRGVVIQVRGRRVLLLLLLVLLVVARN